MELKSVQFAEDYDLKKLKFQQGQKWGMQPKIDGVRGCNLHGWMTARTMRKFTNQHTTLFFSRHGFRGFDGELCAEAETHPRLCSLTTSATGTIGGEPWLMWHIFDYLTTEIAELPYIARYQMARDRIASLQSSAPEVASHLQIVPMEYIDSFEQFEAKLQEYADLGYEGGILRGLDVPHKNGRSSPTHRGLLRCKTFIEVAALITELHEGQRNENELEQDLLGKAKRSTHAENMVANGMVGAVTAMLLEDAIHPLTRRLVFPKGTSVRFSAGRMDHADRAHYFKNPHLLLGKRMKGQIFPHGEKDKARFPTFQTLIADSDYVPK